MVWDNQKPVGGSKHPAEKAGANSLRDIRKVANDDRAPAIETIDTLDVEYTCRSGLTASQERALTQLLSVFSISALLAPGYVFLILSYGFWLGFILIVLWRLILLFVGWPIAVTRLFRRRPIAQTGDDLPIYTVLVAVYDEVAVMPQLASSLNAIQWAQGRLDIKLLFEVDDEETYKAAVSAGFADNVSFVTVPDGLPRTKPRALNYGLSISDGAFVCVFDAEDRPDPDQLLRAYAQFQKLGPDYACFQAQLYADNAHESLLAAHWALDYQTQFGLLIRAQAALGVPISIGGTSNHFRRSALDEVGGWDSWNVTEDADLGFRLARYGYKVGSLRSTTYEDAPTHFDVWYRQRSRWIKGFIQTWFVLMRRPRDLRHRIGFGSFLALQLSLGGAIIAPIVHGPAFLFVASAMTFENLSLGIHGVGLLLSGLGVSFLSDVLAPGRWTLSRVEAVLTRPFYWPLHSLAAVKAIIELARAPHFWAKTPHTPHKTRFE